jgi:hypothetical protein
MHGLLKPAHTTMFKPLITLKDLSLQGVNKLAMLQYFLFYVIIYVVIEYWQTLF